MTADFSSCVASKYFPHAIHRGKRLKYQFHWPARVNTKLYKISRRQNVRGTAPLCRNLHVKKVLFLSASHTNISLVTSFVFIFEEDELPR